ncbi:hypothetical protein ACHAPT_004362 [Fusarium lateritium]
MTEPELNPTSEKPIFVGMLGPPGSGKSFQCRLLAERFVLEHVGVGDLLRAEMERQGSPHRAMIRTNMMRGSVGPPEITVGILKDHIHQRFEQGSRVFVIDGFPRLADQLEFFEAEVGSLDLLIYLDCCDFKLRDRLMFRGRFDDEIVVVDERLRRFSIDTANLRFDFKDRGK